MSKTFKIQVDGAEVDALAGDTLLDAAARAGVEIPTLCHDSRLNPVGSCRMCLVEVEKMPKLMTACTMDVAPDMVVKITTMRNNNDK